MKRSVFITIVLLSLTGLLATGCRKGFDGSIEFRNRSPKELCVTTVAGFPHEPPVGVLVAGGRASSDLGRMELPQRVTVTWRYVGQPDTSAVVSLASVPPKIAGGTVAFEFTETSGWSVRYEAK
jgi:hypothetical protein